MSGMRESENGKMIKKITFYRTNPSDLDFVLLCFAPFLPFYSFVRKQTLWCWIGLEQSRCVDQYDHLLSSSSSSWSALHLLLCAPPGADLPQVVKVNVIRQMHVRGERLTEADGWLAGFHDHGLREHDTHKPTKHQQFRFFVCAWKGDRFLMIKNLSFLKAFPTAAQGSSG